MAQPMANIVLTDSVVWRHYKGGRYVVLFTAETHQHNGDVDVVYLSLTYGSFVTRPFARDSRGQDSWTDIVRWPNGVDRQRFVPESSLTSEDIRACGFEPVPQK